MTKNECGAEAFYCGERLRCVDTNCRLYHTAVSMRFGHLCWNDEKRPQPAVMFHSGTPGNRFGSYEADSMMTAASIMADAVNRLEFVVMHTPGLRR